MTTPRLILASASPRRRELLAAIGLQFDVVPSDIDETLAGGSAVQVATDLARKKASAVRVRYEDGVIIAADTIVSIDGRMLGKPERASEAREMLVALRGCWHEVTTGIGVLAGGPDQKVSEATTTRVLMRDYSDAEIAATIEAGTPFDKAGAYAIQDEVFHPVERYDGCYCNVVGLPLWALLTTLKSLDSPTDWRRPDEVFECCAACPERPAMRSASISGE